MLPCRVAADRGAALVGGGVDGREGGGPRHSGESRWKVGRGAEQLVVVDAIGGRNARDRIALTHIILDRRVKEGVGHRAARGDCVEEEIERVPARAKLDLAVGIERVVVDRLHQRTFDEIGGAGNQHKQVGNAPDRLIGITHLVIDMDRSGGRDHPGEKPDPDQHLEAERDHPHALAPYAGKNRAQSDARGRNHHDKRFIARIGENQCDQPECIHRLGKAVIGVEAGVDRPCRGRGPQHGKGQQQAKDTSQDHLIAPLRQRRPRRRARHDHAAA